MRGKFDFYTLETRTVWAVLASAEQSTDGPDKYLWKEPLVRARLLCSNNESNTCCVAYNPDRLVI